LLSGFVSCELNHSFISILLDIWLVAALWLYHSWNRSVVLLLLSLIKVHVAVSIAALAVLERLGGLDHGRLVRGHGLGGGGDFVVDILLRNF